MEAATRQRRRQTLLWAVAVTVVVEVVTVVMRFGSGITAVEFNRTAPLWLQVHHMFWSLPLLLVVPLVWRRPRVCGAVCGIAWGLILSDLLHHFVVLPITVGQTGWHWP